MVYDLIADAGSTKVHWALVDVAEGTVIPVLTEGLNALMASDKEIESLFSRVAGAAEEDARFNSAWYYGAGCATPRSCLRIEENIRNVFRPVSVEVASDLLGAARGLLGSEPGIAAILGTGSNSCLYDGREIIANTPSLGYVLGDEGSGNAIGRRLLSDYFKHQMPEEVSVLFEQTLGPTIPEVLENVYRQPGANRWLAGFAKFAAGNIGHEYVHDLVAGCFRGFIRRNILPYDRVNKISGLPLCFTGGVAFHFAGLLREVCASEGLPVSRIIQSPLEGLVKHRLMLRHRSDHVNN